MKHRFFRNSTLAISLSALVAPLALAEPKIEDITYSSQEIIVTGKGFGEGPKVVLFENFERGNTYSDMLKGKGSGWADKLVLLKEDSGNYAHRAKNPATDRMAQISVDFGNNYTEAFISFSVKVPDGTYFPDAKALRTFSGSSSWKFAWLMSDSDGYSSRSKFDMCLPTHTGGGIFSLAGNDGNMGRLEKGGVWWDWDDYNHMTSYIKVSRFNPTLYSWSVTNSKTHLETAGMTPPAQFSETNASFNRVNIPGWWRRTEGINFDGLYDNLYVAVGENALARAVITDNPNYSKSKTNITILPKEWGQQRITFDADVVPNDKHYYLHIFDRNGERSARAIRICPKCPKPAVY